MTFFLTARRHLLLSACLVGVTAAHAAPLIDKPVTLVVGFAPGGAADTVARALADELGKRIEQRVVVENKSGAGGNLATQFVATGPTDGSVLLFAAINLATNPALMPLKYDPKADLQMVSQITSVPVVMLAPATGSIGSAADALREAKKVGGLKIGSGGNGTSSHLAAELFARSQGATFVHVPYRGGAPANQALMAGDIELMFDLMSGTLKSMVDGQRIRPLAVMQETRLAALPDVPSAKEIKLSPSTYIRSWQGIAVRSGTPKPIVDALHAAVVAAASTPAFKARVDLLGSEVTTSPSPAAFQQLYRSELDRWADVIKAANIKVE
ncbi:MAG: tripartite tricarboxylate transporter substrate binding protein [Rhizobacter sp.]|nr:tripartite tricarboxylate transporter substrate binding protein [Rhizobacter sp.]